MSIKYRSWISTVSGHLFFHLSKPWNYRSDRIVGDMVHFNEKIGNQRYIFISLLADLRDYNKKNKVKYTRVFFCAQTENSDSAEGKNLKGIIGYFENKENKLYEYLEQKLLKEYFNLQKKLSSMKKYEIEDKKDDLIKSLNSYKSNILNFEHKNIHKSIMECSISYTGMIELSNAINSKATRESSKDEFRQAYYFLKFIFHNHTHHLNTQEDIFRLSKNNLSDKQFASLMISDVKKHIVESRNQRVGMRHLRGVSTYAKSLLYVLKSEGYIKSGRVKKEESYFNNIIESIDVYLENEHKFDGITTVKDLFNGVLKIFIILMAIITPYIILISKDTPKNFTIPLFNNIVFFEGKNYSLYEQIIILYGIGFLVFFSIVAYSDYFYSRENSFIHRIIQRIKTYINYTLKTNHNPTLNKNPFNYCLLKIIDFQHYVFHIEFNKLKWFKYFKPFAIVLIIIYFLNN